MSLFHPTRSIYFNLIAYALGLLGIVVVQAFADISTLHELSTGSVELQRNWVQGTSLLGKIDFSIEAFRLAEVQRVLAFNDAGRAAAEADATRRLAEVTAAAQQFERLAGHNCAPEFATFRRAWAHYQSDHALWLAGAGDEMALPGSTLDRDDKATDAAVDALDDAYSDKGAARAAAGVRLAYITMRFDVWAAMICVALAITTQMGARRRVVGPLLDITAAMTALAAGARETQIPGRDRKDEIGRMAAACEVFRLNVVALDMAHEAARRAEEQAQRLARHDALTGLPNRRVFSADLEAALARVEKGHGLYALLLIDLDDFKKVNDIQGHHAGDIVLCEVAHRLEEAVRKSDTLARLGGDEFAIITHTHGDMPEHLEQTKRLASRLLGLIREPIEIGESRVEIGASIGICTFSAATADVTSLLRAADIAMYRAKESGRFTFRFFEQSMDDEMREREALERDVARAIADGSIHPHYQPLVDINRQRIRGFEALARWTDPSRGNVPPDQFIPIIEQLGLTAELSSSILRQACRDAQAWPPDICVAINVSPFELKDHAMPARIANILRDEHMSPHRLEVEITESALVSDLPGAKVILTTLQSQGITICLDDFGTGYSSLYHLRELNFDKIKIDRSFVQAMRANAESEKIIDAILGLTGSLHLPTVAEGIEDAATLRMLEAKGCWLGQGYYFGKAMPAAEAMRLLEHGLEKATA